MNMPLPPVEEKTNVPMPTHPPAVTFLKCGTQETSGLPDIASLNLMPKFGGVTLKKKADVIPFKLLKIYDPINHWTKSIDERMRFLDTIRRYTPLPEECEDLHISSQRYDLHAMKAILELSGACIGVRFTTDQLQSLQSIFHELDQGYERLDKDFKAYPSKTKKIKLVSVPLELFSHPTYVNWVQHCKIKNVLADVDMNIFECLDLSSVDGLVAAGEDNSIIVDLIKFNILADCYAYSLTRVHELVLMKQSEIPPPDQRLHLDKDKDPDALFGKKYPDWLNVFLLKYETIQTTIVGTTQSSGTKKSLHMTVGKLAAFISCCVVGSLPCSEDDLDALDQLLHASNDDSVQFYADACNHPIHNLQDQQIEIPRKNLFLNLNPNQDYWSGRIFRFLSSLTELKSCPRDEASLHKYDVFKQNGGNI